MTNYNSETVSGGGVELALSFGDVASDTEVLDGGTLNVSSGAFAENTHASGGKIFVESGGSVMKTSLEGGAYLHLSGGATATDLTIASEAYGYVHAGASAGNVVVSGQRAYLYISSGGVVSGVSLMDSGTIMMSSGGVMEDLTLLSGGSFRLAGENSKTTVSSGGSFVVDNGAVATDISVHQGGALYVGAHGQAIQVCEMGGSVTYEPGADVSFVSNTLSGMVWSGASDYGTLHSGTTAVDGSVVESARLYIFGGSALRLAIGSNGYGYMTSGIVTSLTVADDDATFYVVSGGEVVSATVSSGGNMEVSGGQARFTTVGQNGSFYVGDGGTASQLTVGTWGQVNVLHGGHVDGGSVADKGAIYVGDGGEVKGMSVEVGGRIRLVTSASAADIIENGGFVEVDSDASASFKEHSFSDAVIGNGKSATVHSGTTAVNATVTNNGRLVLLGGSAQGLLVSSAAQVEVSGGQVTDARIDVANFYLSSGTVEDTKVYNYGKVYLMADGALAKNIQVYGNGGVSALSGTLQSTTVGSWGSCNIGEAAVASETVVGSGGSMEVYGSASGVTVNQGGKLFVSSGGVAQAVVENGGYVYVGSNGANVQFQSNVFIGSAFQNGAVGTVHSGTTAVSAIVDGAATLEVLGGRTEHTQVGARGCETVSGGMAVSTTVNGYGGSQNVLVAGVASATSVSNFGHQHVQSGGTALDTEIGSSGTLWVQSSGFASGAEVGADGSMTVSAYGSAAGIVVGRAGMLTVSAGGNATDIVENGGYVSLDDGAHATFASNVVSGLELGVAQSASFHSGTTGTDTTVGERAMLDIIGGSASATAIGSAGAVEVTGHGSLDTVTVADNARLNLKDGSACHVSLVGSGTVNAMDAGSLSDVNVTKGCLNVYSLGYAEKVNVTGGAAYIREKGVASDVTVNGGGCVYVSSGGSVNGLDVQADGYASAGVQGNISGITVGSGGYFSVNAAAVVSGIVEDGGYVAVGDGGNASFSAHEIENLKLTSGMSATLHSGTTATSASITSGYLDIYSGGVAHHATVATNGRLRLSGGSATGVTLASGASVAAASGGMSGTSVLSGGRLSLTGEETLASDTVLFGGGNMVVESGASALGTVLKGKAYLEVMEDGFISGGEVSAGASVYVSGASGADMALHVGGSLTVCSGATFTGIIEDGGYVDCHEGGTVGFASHAFENLTLGGDAYRSATVHSGTTAVSTLLQSGGVLKVLGGEARNTQVSSGGKLSLADGIALETEVSAGGTMDVTAGGEARDVELHSGAGLYVSSGASARDVKVHSGGYCDVNATGVVQNMGVYGSAGIWGEVKSAEVFSGGLLYGGGLMSGVVISSGARVTLYASGSAVNATVEYGGLLVLDSNASATGIVEDGGYVSFQGDGAVTFAAHTFRDVVIQNGMSATIHSGTTGTGLQLEQRGILDVVGGNASDVQVSAGGSMRVSGGSLSDVQVQWGGYMAMSGGSATELAVSGTVSVSSGSLADIVVASNGYAFFNSGTVASDVEVCTLGSAFVRTGTTISNLTIRNGGYVYVDAADTAIVRGKLTVATSNVPTVNGTWDVDAVDFRLDEYHDSSVMLNSMDRLTKLDKVNISVDGIAPLSNTCYLASQAYGFHNEVTVTDVQTDKVIGTLSVANEYAFTLDNGIRYKLEKTDGGTLVFTVKDAENPTITNIVATPSGATNGDVVVTAEFDDNLGLESCKYRIGSGSWMVYEEAGVKLTKNATITFQAKDIYGNVTEKEFTVDTIDKETPVITVRPNTTLPAQTVKIDVLVSESVPVSYSEDQDTWHEMEGTQLAVTSNGTYYFKATDAAGNTGTASCTVTNVDRTAPVITLKAITEVPVESTKLTATTNEKSTLAWSRDSQTWNAFSGTLTVTSNGTYYFKATDAAGNVGTSDITFDNIAEGGDLHYVLNDDENVVMGLEASYTDLPKGNQLEDIKLLENGYYRLDLSDVPEGYKGTVTLVQGTKKTTLKDGVETLLAAGNYTLQLATTKPAEGDVTLVLKADSEARLFTQGDNSDDWTDLATMGAESTQYGKWSLQEKADNWVGMGDTVDYYAVTLDYATSLALDLTGTDAAKVTVNTLQSKTDARKETTTYSLKALQSTTLAAPNAKKGQTETAVTTKNILLTAGTYYIGVQSTNAAKGGNATYTMAFSENAIVYSKGDNTDDWTDLAANGAESNLYQNWDRKDIDDGWVGYGDAIDYYAFTLDHATSLALDLTGTDAAKVTVNALQSKTDARKGTTTYSLKALQSTTLAAPNAKKGQTETAVTTKNLLLQAGTYYIGVQSTNAAKGGNDSYTMGIGENTVIFDKGNNTDDTWNGEGVTAFNVEKGWEDWVGYGDAVDYKLLELDGGAKLSLDVASSDATTLDIVSVTDPVKGKTKKWQTTTLALDKATGTYKATTKEVQLAAGTYYLVMTSKNAAKGGNADYKVTVNESTKWYDPDNFTDNNTWQTATELEGDEAKGWVGFGDAADYLKFSAEEDGALSFQLDDVTREAFSARQIKIACLDSKGKAIALGTMSADGKLATKVAVAAGNYILGITCADVKKYDTSYAIAING